MVTFTMIFWILSGAGMRPTVVSGFDSRGQCNTALDAVKAQDNIRGVCILVAKQ